ncbi:aminotransferase class I/II-fold pyridoxal phosphate-dependent enzyme [Spiroplasma eriocheiris]|uniref:cysteine-S-conjugate beta-lyase n=1 Tax=Spiroplasma eriocheiris TaxID=315358 RepID=A0A0H3XK43_9MOLU|nr:aminotransferase class I/II-fold pyridoxal phosphate-dependent enzyme [Spiroplasma eriocheiris]AHF57233.1 putative aminotransferase [Spiroplasma eriocheiris CCTCC M 207170]AKM53699.1 cystathionine beta-lyase [Spiroplasma eriocheiris]
MKKLVSNHEFLCEHHTSRRYEGMKHSYDLMLTCADSDFKIPLAMQEDLIKVIKEGDVSYSFLDNQLLEAINTWYTKQYNLSFAREELIIGSGVIHLMQIALEVLTKPGDGVIVQPPVYDPFYEIIENKDRKIIMNHLLYDEEQQYYTMNFLELEELMQQHKVMILCSPHNPVGRIWKEAEIAQLLSLAAKYNVFIISDEIWQDIVFSNAHHHPLFSFNSPAINQVLVLSSQAKTYNLGGAQIGYGLSYNRDFIVKMHHELTRSIHYASTNYLSAKMIISGYLNRDNYDWLAAYKTTLEENYHYLVSELEKATNIKVTRIEGTYLGWLNMSKVVKTRTELEQKLDSAHIHAINGSVFSPISDLFIRVDFALDKKTITEVARRLIDLFK